MSLIGVFDWCRLAGFEQKLYVYTASRNLGCSNPTVDGSIERNCNSVDLPYLDGASFSGYRAEPWPVPNSDRKLWFRGIKNLDATLDWLFEHGRDRGAARRRVCGRAEHLPPR